MSIRIKDPSITENTSPAATTVIPGENVGGNDENFQIANLHKNMTDFTGDSGSGGVRGMVKAPAAGDTAAFKFLMANGSWLGLNPPQGWMSNGKIVPSVASNNLTVAIKTLAGANPSASDPVYVRIGDSIRVITAPLSVTKNAATNWFNSGGNELKTQEIDYFVYLGYNATDGVVIGFSRIPYATQYSDFSVTTTNEKYAAISTITTAAAGDYYENVGRFAATLSGTAGFTWSVPAYTALNLINRPINETRWLSWVPVTTCGGSLTYGTITNRWCTYKMIGNHMSWSLNQTGTLGGSAANTILNTLPFTSVRANTANVAGGFGQTSGGVQAAVFVSGVSPSSVTVSKYDLSNYATSGANVNQVQGFYEI